MRLISRVAELYVFPAAVPIFGARAAGDIGQITSLFDKLDNALGSLSAFLGDGNESWHAFGDRLTTADGALAPFLFYACFLGNACNRAVLARHRKLEKFWEGAQSDPVLATVIKQMAQAMGGARSRS